ncbi:hypothetical protein HG536_0B03190 [Torulaspora globosa]|uniref:Conserved oligomeric Golgi complex subunit 5 n=1 Tax=Torulaspora globosa TaxID=48254 RepID=A0A7G3ZD70_9SACH|nr:uncharacterized protein HG536_0B03190 [Torulaspora globosa]QLL31456.1 hypothetical protein HG536_0B03190 [Torulaspora globosa]
MSEDLEDFEVLLTDDFSSTQFCNDILVTVNGQPGTDELDLGTPLKKLRYDLNEINLMIEETLKNNPTNVIDQMYRGKAVRNVTQRGLASSLEYLDISYQRVQREVIQPFERAQSLQNVLSKVHQTSILLRDGLVVMHLTGRLQMITGRRKPWSIDTMVELAAVYSQIDASLRENANLKSLKLIKQLESDTILPTRKELLSLLSIALTNALTAADENLENQADISKLAEALHTMSSREFTSTVQKAVLSFVAKSIQVLSKTLNSIKNFPLAFGEVVRRGTIIRKIEQVLQNVKFEETNLLAIFISRSTPKSVKPNRLYWEKVSDAFRREFEVSFSRGGPVGKLLSRNSDMIVDTIKQKMTDPHNHGGDPQLVDLMLQSVSIARS